MQLLFYALLFTKLLGTVKLCRYFWMTLVKVDQGKIVQKDSSNLSNLYKWARNQSILRERAHQSHHR